MLKKFFVHIIGISEDMPYENAKSEIAHKAIVQLMDDNNDQMSITVFRSQDWFVSHGMTSGCKGTLTINIASEIRTSQKGTRYLSHNVSFNKWEPLYTSPQQEKDMGIKPDQAAAGESTEVEEKGSGLPF